MDFRYLQYSYLAFHWLSVLLFMFFILYVKGGREGGRTGRGREGKGNGRTVKKVRVVVGSLERPFTVCLFRVTCDLIHYIMHEFVYPPYTALENMIGFQKTTPPSPPLCPPCLPLEALQPSQPPKFLTAH